MRVLQKGQKACLSKFKQQFISQYLPSLRERHQHNRKDHKSCTETVKGGMVVLIHGDDKRQNWKLGVVRDLLRGGDGEVRAVSLRTATGVTNRPLSKLFPLEVSENTDQQLHENVPRPEPLRRSARIAAAARKPP